MEKTGMKRIVLITVCCLAAVLSSACMTEDEVEKSYIEHSQRALITQLYKCYGMEQKSYSMKVADVDTNPNNDGTEGVIWKVKSGETEFSVFVYGGPDREYQDADVWSNRYSAAFTEYAEKEAKRKIDENGALGDLPYTVSYHYSDIRFDLVPKSVRPCLPISVTPEGFSDYLETLHKASLYSGSSMAIHVFSEEMIELTEEQMQKLQKAFPVGSWTVTVYHAEPGGETDENCIGSIHYWYGREAIGVGEEKEWNYKKY